MEKPAGRLDAVAVGQAEGMEDQAALLSVAGPAGPLPAGECAKGAQRRAGSPWGLLRDWRPEPHFPPFATDSAHSMGECNSLYGMYNLLCWMSLFLEDGLKYVFITE